MSAISGIVRFDGAPIAPGTIERMTAAMAARGPDGIAHWVAGNVAMGHCALNTTPESVTERQPFANEDGSVVAVLDGRVDNRDELRRGLEGRHARLGEAGDAELVLRAYEAWGEACPDRIVGEFVFFVWDRRCRLLFGARDAIGTRHFYYHAGADRFAFASEIRALLATGEIEPRLNEWRLLDSIVTEFDRDDEVGTFYEGINRLPAGHAMRVTNQGVRTWRYWDPGSLEEIRLSSSEEYQEAFRERLREAIACRLRATGPVGAQLSGGLDSSSVVGTIRKHFAQSMGAPLRTFSMVHEDRSTCPEWRSVAALLCEGGLQPVLLDPTLVPGSVRAHAEAIAEYNEPTSLVAGYTDLLIAEAARAADCRVLLESMAGDLLFYSFNRSAGLRAGGLRHLPGVIAASRRHRDGRPIRTLVHQALWALTPEPVRAIARKVNAAFWPLRREACLLNASTARRYFDRRLVERRKRSALASGDTEQTRHAANFTGGLLSYTHEITSQIALSRGVELRSPYSDRRVVEFAIRMPLQAKLCDGWYKRFLREAMHDTLPDAVRWRTDVGMHPGQEFRRRLIREMSRSVPEVWNRPIVERKLGAWIDAGRVARAWRRHAQTGELSTGIELLGLVVSAQWVGKRFASIQSR